jgi:hypothetical protein
MRRLLFCCFPVFLTLTALPACLDLDDVSTEEDEGPIIVPGCDAPPTDPYRVCEGNGGGGSGTGGGGGGTGGGSGSCGGVTCLAGERCYQNYRCARPPGTPCWVGYEPEGTRCSINIEGRCQCYPINPLPNTLTSQTSEPEE